MRHHRIVFFASLTAALIACSGADAALDSDAAPGDAAIGSDASPDAADTQSLACVATPSPQNAPQELQIDVHALEPSAELTDLADVAVTVRRSADDTVLAAGTTDESGRLGLRVATGGQRLSTYIAFEKDGYVSTRYLSTSGFFTNVRLAIGLATTQLLDEWYSAVGETRTPGTGSVIARSIDCDGEGLEQTTLSVDGATSVTYWNSEITSWDASLPRAINSFGFATNVPAGSTEVGVEFEQTKWPTHSQTVTIDAVTYIGIEPYLAASTSR